MLLDTIEKSDQLKHFKLVCVEVLRAKGEVLPKQVTCVPALLTMPERCLMQGKTVFDYLLLPTTGKLHKLQQQQQHSNTVVNGNKPNMAYDIGAGPSPLPFSLGGFGDNLTDINHEGSTADGVPSSTNYIWTLLSEDSSSSQIPTSLSTEETRPTKQVIDIDKYKMQRDMDLQQNDINTTVLSPPSFTR